jgi:hypothetical protein
MHAPSPKRRPLNSERGADRSTEIIQCYKIASLFERPCILDMFCINQACVKRMAIFTLNALLLHTTVHYLKTTRLLLVLGIGTRYFVTAILYKFILLRARYAIRNEISNANNSYTCVPWTHPRRC